MKDGPLWSRVSRRMWRSTDFRAMGPMPPCVAILWLYLLTGEHRTKVPGLFVLGAGTMSDDLRWQPAAVRKHLATLVEKGHVKVDADTNLVWIPNSLDHNLPDNPNMVMGWKRDWQTLPSSALKTEAREAIRKGLEALPRPEKSTVTYAEAFAVALGERNPPASGKATGNGGGNVTPPPPADVPETLGGIEDSEGEGEKTTTPKPPPVTDATPPVQPQKPDPVVVVTQPSSAEPTDDAPRPARKPLPAGVVENGERLIAIMGAASNRNLDAVRGDSRKRLDLFSRIAAYELTDAESREIGRLCIEPRKVWPWARSGAFDHGVSLSFLVGSANEGGFNGDAFGQVVALARKNLAAAAEKATRAAAPPAAPSRPLRPENTPGTPEYIAANERTRINAQSRIKAAVAAEESASAPASAVAQ